MLVLSGSQWICGDRLTGLFKRPWRGFQPCLPKQLVSSSGFTDKANSPMKQKRAGPTHPSPYHGVVEHIVSVTMQWNCLNPVFGSTSPSLQVD